MKSRNRMKYVNTRIWQSDDSFVFPEKYFCLLVYLRENHWYTFFIGIQFCNL